MGANSKRNAIARKNVTKLSTTFQQIDLNTREHPEWMTRAYHNNQFIVMISDNERTTHGPAIRAMVQKHNDTPILNHWAEMQRIKNQLFGAETTAIEYYPAESQLVNMHNIYWMWIFPSGVLPAPLMP